MHFISFLNYNLITSKRFSCSKRNDYASIEMCLYDPVKDLLDLGVGCLVGGLNDIVPNLSTTGV